jgi:hypothetical protein
MNSSVVDDSKVFSCVEVLLYIVIPEITNSDRSAVEVDARQHWIEVDVL